jgi:hypothetical protein
MRLSNSSSNLGSTGGSPVSVSQQGGLARPAWSGGSCPARITYATSADSKATMTRNVPVRWIGVGELLFIGKPVVHLVEQAAGLARSTQLADELAYL